jgi:hypothetical protein
LLLIKSHTLNSKITQDHLGKTAARAYDVPHGFSNQYILEFDVFSSVIEEMGLYSDPKYFSKFPYNKPGTVSINYIIASI